MKDLKQRFFMIPKNLVPNSAFNCSENSAKLFHGNSAGNIVPESRSMAIPRINIYYFKNSGNGKYKAICLINRGSLELSLNVK